MADLLRRPAASNPPGFLSVLGVLSGLDFLCILRVLRGEYVLRMIQPVDQIRDDADDHEHGDDNQADGQPERHRDQKELPMNGSMWPQNSTAAQMKIADAAATLAENGASSPAPTLHAA